MNNICNVNILSIIHFLDITEFFKYTTCCKYIKNVYHNYHNSIIKEKILGIKYTIFNNKNYTSYKNKECNYTLTIENNIIKPDIKLFKRLYLKKK